MIIKIIVTICIIIILIFAVMFMTSDKFKGGKYTTKINEILNGEIKFKNIDSMVLELTKLSDKEFSKKKLKSKHEEAIEKINLMLSKLKKLRNINPCEYNFGQHIRESLDFISVHTGNSDVYDTFNACLHSTFKSNTDSLRFDLEDEIPEFITTTVNILHRSVSSDNIKNLESVLKICK